MKNTTITHHSQLNDWELTLLAMIELIKQDGVKLAKKQQDCKTFAGMIMFYETQQGFDFWIEAYYDSNRKPIEP